MYSFFMITRQVAMLPSTPRIRNILGKISLELANYKPLYLPIYDGQRYQSGIFQVLITQNIPDIVREILANTLVSGNMTFASRNDCM